MSSRGGEVSPAIRENSSSAAAPPMAAGSWVTTLTGGVSLSASAKSSKPTSATEPCPLSMAPIVVRSLLVNSAVGGCGGGLGPAAQPAPDQLRIRFQAPLAEGRAEADVALADRPHVVAVAQERDP